MFSVVFKSDQVGHSCDDSHTTWRHMQPVGCWRAGQFLDQDESLRVVIVTSDYCGLTLFTLTWFEKPTPYVTREKSPNNELTRRNDDRWDWKVMVADACNRPGA